MAFTAYLQENEILLLSRGRHLHTFFKPLHGFFKWTAQPHCGAFAAFPNKNLTNARQMPEWSGMGTLGIDWAIASTQDDIENRRPFFDPGILK